MPVKADQRPFERENEKLRSRLEELEDMLRSIRSGEVDALVVETAEGDQVFTLKSADQTYRLMVEQMQEGAATLSDEGVVLYCNPFLAALLDVPMEALLASPLSGFLDEQGAASLSALLRSAESGVSQGEISFRSGARHVPTRVSLKRLPLEGAPVFCLFVTDLTESKRREEERAQLEREQAARAAAEEANRAAQEEIERRKQAEQSLRQAHKRLGSVLASITDSYIVADSQWRLLEMNSAAERTILRRPASELIGKVVWDEYPESTDSEFRRQCQRALDEGQPVHFDAESLVDGRWFEVHAYPRDGRLEIYLRDISERKRAEEERAKVLERERLARTDAEAANRLKDEFLATLSHELRSPLNAIVAWAHILREQDLLDPGTTRRAVEAIHRNAQAQAQLVSDILDVSRIITGQFRVSSRPVRLSEVIESAADTVLPAAQAKDIRLELAIDPAAGPVSGDASRLQQVVWNLLSNAIKFAPMGGRVQVRLEDAGSSVELSVTDDGSGIDPAFLPYVFERFRQADSSSTRQHAGLGLGLAIVRHLVELHGGTVEARNGEDRRGAVFIVRLPRRQGVSADSASAEQTALANAREKWQPAPSLQDVSILVVDDEKDILEAMAIGLGRYGARVATASSASEALDALKRERPHVLVADIGMPGEDGYALLQKVRALPAERGGATPAIALTAYAGQQDRLDALRTGFQMHVPKPVTPAELAIAVASLVPPVRPGATSC
jgi:PAS domain S-box-containing protein